MVEGRADLMAYVVRIIGLLLDDELVPTPEDGLYVRLFDISRHDGIGPVPVTRFPRLAAHFASPADAVIWYRTRSTVRPTRPDGLPNRPLTAFTVEIIQAAEDPCTNDT
jgi:hypothetical protein